MKAGAGRALPGPVGDARNNTYLRGWRGQGSVSPTVPSGLFPAQGQTTDCICSVGLLGVTSKSDFELQLPFLEKSQTQTLKSYVSTQ